MRKLAAVVLMIVASVSYADKAKSKFKDKRFEPVVRSASEYAGSYRGPDESYGLVLEVAPDGKLRGNYVELGRVAVLHAIQVNGADFTARASFDDGSLRTLRGSFAMRTLNGATAFGARVHDVKVEGMGEVDTFFERN
ncbi:MAG TPA: hypothetical protein VJZ00_05530 [Thermoanaerobaculia bacterium]|nr:hypothetical protein [Thermoanaerobaculia bacterium]